MADKPLAFPWLNPKGPQESMAFPTMDPAVAEQCKQQLVQQHLLFKQQTAALASAVYRQVCLANEIPVFVEENGSRVQIWNPLETVKAEVAAAHAQGADLLSLWVHCCLQTRECFIMSTPEETVLPADAKTVETTAAAAAAVAATTSTVSSPEAKTARLVPEQEQVLLRFFGAQDRVDREEALLLARQVRILVAMHATQTPYCFVVHEANENPPACACNTCSCLGDHLQHQSVEHSSAHRAAPIHPTQHFCTCISLYLQEPPTPSPSIPIISNALGYT